MSWFLRLYKITDKVRTKLHIISSIPNYIKVFFKIKEFHSRNIKFKIQQNEEKFNKMSLSIWDLLLHESKWEAVPFQEIITNRGWQLERQTHK